jgi:integrase/recombinase XerD
MATVAIVLNTSKKLSNNEHPIALRVTNQYIRKYFSIATLLNDQSLKFRCSTNDWRPPQAEDDGLGRLLKTYKAYKACNDILAKKLIEAKGILKTYDDNGVVFTFEQFEADLKNRHKAPTETQPQKFQIDISQPTIQEYYSRQIAILDEQHRDGMAGLYKENQSVLKKFKPDALLTDINFRFLESFEYWMRNIRGNLDTTISVKMRNVQRVINQAIEDKIFDREAYPFGEKKYSINKRLDHKTRKKALQLDMVGKLKTLELKPGSAVHFAQQVALFSYYCRGMNFGDIANLKWNSVTDTHIYYTRNKTRGKFEIPINQHNLAILTYFKASYTIGEGYVFPVIDPTVNQTSKQRYTRRKSALKAVNDNLKKLAVMIDEPELKLSTNVLRHTYATGLKRSGANVSHIKESLGHATEFQTQTYLDQFETGVIESWENKMFDS